MARAVAHVLVSTLACATARDSIRATVKSAHEPDHAAVRTRKVTVFLREIVFPLES
jgi:hypothetical protein